MSRLQWTKQVVDNHVSNILKQQKDEKQVSTLRRTRIACAHRYICRENSRQIAIIDYFFP